MIDSSSTHPRSSWLQAMMEDAQDPKLEPKIEMEDTMSDDTLNSSAYHDDDNLIYDYDQFKMDKDRRRYESYYDNCKIVVKRGIGVEDFNAHAPRIRPVLDAQGWIDMVVDHCPAIKEIVHGFDANLHNRCSDFFRTWVRKKEIVVTSTFISNIMGAPQVHDPRYPWLGDGLPTHAEMVKCFVDGCPHKMETKRVGSFQMHDLSNNV
jgi:hypothetical protein